MWNGKAGLEQWEMGRGRGRMREWWREMAHKREGRKEGRRGGEERRGEKAEALSSQCESASWRSVRVQLRRITATLNLPLCIWFIPESTSAFSPSVISRCTTWHQHKCAFRALIMSEKIVKECAVFTHISKNPVCKPCSVCLCRAWRRRATSVRPGCDGRVEVGGDGADSCTADTGQSQ